MTSPARRCTKLHTIAKSLLAEAERPDTPTGLIRLAHRFSKWDTITMNQGQSSLEMRPFSRMSSWHIEYGVDACNLQRTELRP